MTHVDRNHSRPTADTEMVDLAPIPPTPARLLRPRAVCERTGLSRSTLWRLERRGDFPPHRQISPNAIGWLEEEVNAWIRSRTSL
jgi:prophage regulatory protein